MKRFAVALALLVASGPMALAHEGHDHRVMGTVSAVQEGQLEVKALKGGAVSTIVVNDQTKLVRDKTPVKLSEIAVGDRVVITAVTQKGKDGKETLVAKEIRVGAPQKEERL